MGRSNEIGDDGVVKKASRGWVYREKLHKSTKKQLRTMIMKCFRHNISGDDVRRIVDEMEDWQREIEERGRAELEEE